MQANLVKQARLSVSGAQAHAARNLTLLNAIENTISALSSDCDLVRAIRAAYAEMFDEVRAHAELIDQEGLLLDQLAKASDACGRIRVGLLKRQHSAHTDPALKPDDGVADAYQAVIDCISHLHDEIDEMSEWIGVHDAVLQPSTGQTFSSVDDLFSSMGLNR